MLDSQNVRRALVPVVVVFISAMSASMVVAASNPLPGGADLKNCWGSYQAQAEEKPSDPGQGASKKNMSKYQATMKKGTRSLKKKQAHCRKLE